MINLLPDETKKQLRAARSNTGLVKYVVFLGCSVIFLAVACQVSYVFLNGTKIEAEKIITNNESKSDSYLSVSSQANAIVAKLSTAKTILDKQVSYSSIIMGIGAVLPEGVVLDELSLSSTSLSSTTSLKMHAKTTGLTDKLKTNFQQSTLFSNFTIQSSNTSSADNSGYPVEINASISINRMDTL